MDDANLEQANRLRALATIPDSMVSDIPEPTVEVTILEEIRDCLHDIREGQRELIAFLEDTVKAITSNPLIALGMKRRRNG